MSNKFLSNLIIVILVIVVSFSAYIVSSTEVKKLARKKVLLEDSLKLINEKINDRIIQIQKLSSEERISRIAVDSLKLEYNYEGVSEISISQEKIKSYEKRINKIYE